MRYTVLSRLFGLFVLVAAAGAALAGAGSEARAQVVPALWEIEDAEGAYTALRLKAALARDPVFAEEDLLDPAEFGCLIGGAIGGIALYADPTLLGLFMDGVAVTGWPAVVYAGWGGLIVATVCTVGQLAAPMVVSLYERYISPSGTFNARDMRP